MTWGDLAFAALVSLMLWAIIIWIIWLIVWLT